MAFTPFVFNTKLIGRGGFPASDQFGNSLSVIQGPDGGQAGTPPGLVLASLLIGSVLPSGSTAPGMYSALFVSNKIDWNTVTPGAGFLTPPDLLGTGDDLDMGTAAGYQRTAVVGYPNQDAAQGRAYFWSRDLVGNWTQTQRVDGTAGGDQFGFASVIYGDWAAVAAFGASAGAGQVQIFNLVAGVWTQTQILAPGDLSAGDGFGQVLCMVGDVLFVGVPQQNSSEGAVYVFTQSGGIWTQVQKITQSAADQLGWSISCDGTTLAVGAIGNDPGHVYVYTLVAGTWTLQATLSEGAGSAQFGSGVSVSRSLLAVGAQFEGTGGAAYLFTGAVAVWTLQQTIVPSDTFADQRFGWSVAAYTAPGAEAWVVVGATALGQTTEGAAYFYGSPSIDPLVTPASQLVFYGVRRLRGERTASDPAPSNYKYYEKSFRIPISFQITAAYNSALPLLSQGQRVLTYIADYDFELRHLIKYVVDADGLPLTSPSPFAAVLFDSTYVARSNLPVLAEFLFDDLITPNGRNFWPSPPIMYKVDANIPLDIYTLVDSSVALPVTVYILFDGVRRVPCV